MALCDMTTTRWLWWRVTMSRITGSALASASTPGLAPFRGERKGIYLPRRVYLGVALLDFLFA